MRIEEDGKEKIILLWESYIKSAENLKKCLLDLKIENNSNVQMRCKVITVFRVLVSVPDLQIGILESLFEKLNELVADRYVYLLLSMLGT